MRPHPPPHMACIPAHLLSIAWRGHCGAAGTRPQGCEVYVAGPGAGGDRATHAHTDTHRTPPASPDVCSHTQSILPSASQGTHVLIHQPKAKTPNSHRVPQQSDTHAIQLPELTPQRTHRQIHNADSHMPSLYTPHPLTRTHQHPPKGVLHTHLP